MAKGSTKILFGLIFFVIIVAALAGGGAWYLTEHRAEDYRATALLLAPQPVEVLSESGDGTEREALGIAVRATAGLTAPDYVALFESDAMADALRESLAAAKEGDAPAPTLEAVRKAMEAESDVALQSNEHVVYRQVVRLNFTATDPALAAAGANAWAAQCVDYVAALGESQRDVRAQALGEELAQAQAELETTRQAQVTLREQTPLKGAELAMMAAREAVEELKQVVRQARADAARGDAALAALKAYVTKAPPAVVMELSMAEATTEAEAAGARAESAFFESQLADAEAAAAAAQSAWAEASRAHEAIEETLERLAPRVNELERALQATDRSAARVTIAAEAVEPESPVGPHRYVLVAGAALLGAIAGMVVYFGLLTIRVYARDLDRT